VAPETDLERRLVEIVQSTLGFPMDGIDVDRKFFELGINSLQLVKLRSALVETCGRDIAMLEMFRHPTIRTLARHLEAPATEENGAAAIQAAGKDRAEARRSRSGEREDRRAARGSSE
jgi:acyl carrier protein